MHNENSQKASWNSIWIPLTWRLNVWRAFSRCPRRRRPGSKESIWDIARETRKRNRGRGPRARRGWWKPGWWRVRVGGGEVRRSVAEKASGAGRRRAARRGDAGGATRNSRGRGWYLGAVMAFVWFRANAAGTSRSRQHGRRPANAAAGAG